ncbi:MAG TPA: hypothetical protein VEZ14_00210 [Dehalococcoidia bacterium]|nr:hypothetical protein [Dehalococcoidia bacterium]
MDIRTLASRRTGFAAAAVIIAAAALAAACSSSTSSADKTATAQAGAPASTAAATSAAAPTVASSPTTAAATSSTPASGSPTVSAATSGDPRLVDAGGMTLYVFLKDTANSGKSACTAACAANWPALTVPAGTTPTAGSGLAALGVITRDDGSTQVTYKGMPLYHFAGDKAPGDENGKSIPNWTLAVP